MQLLKCLITLHLCRVLFQIGSVQCLILVDFDESSMEKTDEISQYLSDIDDVLTYYNDDGLVKYVCMKLILLNGCLVLLQIIGVMWLCTSSDS